MKLITKGKLVTGHLLLTQAWLAASQFLWRKLESLKRTLCRSLSSYDPEDNNVFKISRNSTTNETILELVKKSSKGRQPFTIDSLFICLLVTGVIVVATGIAGNISVLLIVKKNSDTSHCAELFAGKSGGRRHNEFGVLLFFPHPTNDGPSRWSCWKCSLYILCQLQRSSHIDYCLQCYGYCSPFSTCKPNRAWLWDITAFY